VLAREAPDAAHEHGADPHAGEHPRGGRQAVRRRRLAHGAEERACGVRDAMPPARECETTKEQGTFG
jgi:hypothetical protein